MAKITGVGGVFFKSKALMNFSTKPTDTNQFVRRHVRPGDPF